MSGSEERNRRAVVTSILQYDGKILLLRRSEQVGSYRGRWAGVSGSIDPGQTPEQQARQEIWEETRLTNDDVRLVAVGEPLRVDDPTASLFWTVHPFRFEVLHPERIQTDWEHVELRWIDPTELSGFETVPRLVDVWARVAPR